MVDWEKIAGNWKEIAGILQQQWGDLTDDEILKTRGEKKQVIGALQRKYGMSEEEAIAALQDFFERQRSYWDRDLSDKP